MKTSPFFTIRMLLAILHMTLPQPFQEIRGLLPFPAISALRLVFICVLTGDSAGHSTPLYLTRGGKTLGLIDLI